MTAASTVAVRQFAGRSALASAGALLLGAVLIGLAASIGIAHTYDGSVTGVASGSVWVILLPAILAVVLSVWKPGLGLAFTAGAGVVMIARLVDDLPVLTAPNTVIRPELFYELSARSQPFTRAPGSILLLVGDLMMVAAGVWAARRLAGGLSFTAERIFDAEPVRPAASSVGPTLLAEALDSADQSPADAVRAVRPDTPQTGPARNNLLIFVGFVGVLALLTASLGLPYSGGYLSDRYLPPELGLWGIGAALALAVVGIIAVLAAAVLPRPLAFALLSGVALGAAVPFLTAVAVRTAGAPVQLNPVVGLGLAGAVLISASGLLARARLVQDGPAGAEESVPVSVRRLNVIGAVLSLLVAASAAAAWRLPQLRYNGGADPKLADGYSISSPLSLPFVVAMIVPLVGGVLWLVPALTKAGRAVAVIGWVALVYAVAQSLYVLGAVVASAAVPNAGFAPPVWSAGAGLWCGVAGMGLGIATLAVGVAASRGAADEALSVPDDDSLARSRAFGTVVAVVLTVLTVVVLALPVYRTSAGSAATLVVGFQVNSWGVLALAAGMIAAAWAGGRATTVSQAVAYPLAGAAILVVRLVVPAAVSAQDGFEKAVGLYAGYATLVAFVAGALALAYSSRTITMSELSTGGERRPAGARAASAGGAGSRSARKGKR
jgi:hypothetical protein